MVNKLYEIIKERDREKRIAKSREQNIKWCAKMNARRNNRSEECDLE